VGKAARICGIEGEEELRARMFALGLRTGREVAVIRRARFSGPLQIRIGSTDLVVRRNEARLIHLCPQTPAGS
jgi:ferrous iron transport protein A